MQYQDKSGLVASAGILSRMATAGWVIPCFFCKFFYPVGLLPVYPSGVINAPGVRDLLPWLALGGLLGILWLNPGGWGRHALLGVGFFLLSLVPVLGFVLMNTPTMVWSMDHLAYIPIIGSIGLTVASWRKMEERHGRPNNGG